MTTSEEARIVAVGDLLDAGEFSIPWEDQLTPASAYNGTTGVPVSALLPPGYGCYLRVFHPFVPWDEPRRIAQTTRSWRELAASAGVDFCATLTWRQLEPVLPLSDDGSGRPWAVWEGELEPARTSALFSALEPSARGPYLFAFELSAFGRPGRPLMYQADRVEGWTLAVSAAQGEGVTICSPEYAWPSDRRWIVRTDWDLCSTYVACDQPAGERVLDEPLLESLEVALRTRVDDCADLQLDRADSDVNRER